MLLAAAVSNTLTAIHGVHRRTDTHSYRQTTKYPLFPSRTGDLTGLLHENKPNFPMTLASILIVGIKSEQI